MVEKLLPDDTVWTVAPEQGAYKLLLGDKMARCFRSATTADQKISNVPKAYPGHENRETVVVRPRSFIGSQQQFAI